MDNQYELLHTILDWELVSSEKLLLIVDQFMSFFVVPDQLGEYFDSTAKLIEETYQINGNNRVNLLCHSMGCLRSIHLLNLQSNEWKDKFINRLITIGAPWLGSSQALEALLEGKLIIC